MQTSVVPTDQQQLNIRQPRTDSREGGWYCRMPIPKSLYPSSNHPWDIQFTNDEIQLIRSYEGLDFDNPLIARELGSIVSILFLKYKLHTIKTFYKYTRDFISQEKLRKISTYARKRLALPGLPDHILDLLKKEDPIRLVFTGLSTS